MRKLEERVRVSTLENGLRIVTEIMPHVATAAIGMWVGAGARHEHEGEHGLSHLLEHMAFKGTGTRDAQAIAEAIEALGGDLNAETGIEDTSYTVRLMGKDVAVGIEILADILTDSRFDEEELIREKSVILQEIAALEDAPDDLATDLFIEAAYKKQAIGRSILGTPQSVQAFVRNDILAYLTRNYRASRMVLAAVGAIDHDEVVAHARRLFAALPEGEESKPASAYYSGGETILERDLEQTQVLIGFKGRSYLDDNVYAMQVFAHVLGGGMSSRLSQEVREKRGLAYSIYAFHWGFADTGLFGMSAGTAPEDAGEVIPVLLETFSKTLQDMTQAEVNRAIAQLKVAHLSVLESPMARADQLARQLLSLGRNLPQDEVIVKLDSITLNDVRFEGNHLLESLPTFVAVGPSREMSGKAESILRIMQGM